VAGGLCQRRARAEISSQEAELRTASIQSA